MGDFIARIIDRMQRGWAMAKAAARALRKEKKLLVFPLLSSLALILVLLSFAVPLGAGKIVQVVMAHEDDAMGKIAGNTLYYLIVFAFYVTSQFVIIFFNSALVACVILHFQGEEPTVGDGFQAAFSRFPQILTWALVSATVGLIFKIIYDTVGRNKIGRIIVAILGAGWAVMTFFVIPILVIERRGPFDAIKRSWKIMTKTWGPNLLANFGIGLLVFILLCIAMLPVYLSSFIGGLAVVFGLAITILLVLLVQLIFSCLRVITTAALYQYAISGVPPKGFKGAGLYDAFEARKYNAY